MFEIPYADMAELADAPDLGSGVHDVQVQVLLSADTNGRKRITKAFPAVFYTTAIFICQTAPLADKAHAHREVL